MIQILRGGNMNFDMFNFEGLDRKVVEDWAERKRKYWRGDK